MNEEEEFEELEYGYLDQNINHLKEESSKSFLTKVHYQNSEYFDNIHKLKKLLDPKEGSKRGNLNAVALRFWTNIR